MTDCILGTRKEIVQAKLSKKKSQTLLEKKIFMDDHKVNQKRSVCGNSKLLFSAGRSFDSRTRF